MKMVALRRFSSSATNLELGLGKALLPNFLEDAEAGVGNEDKKHILLGVEFGCVILDLGDEECLEISLEFRKLLDLVQ